MRVPRFALTLRPPWAWAAMFAGKDVENRTWTSAHGRLAPGDRLWIHASSAIRGGQYDYDAMVEILSKRRPDGSPAVTAIPPWGDIVKGALLGSVEFRGTVTDSRSAWAKDGAVHWLIGNPELLDEPIPCRGHLGLWQVPWKLLPEKPSHG